MDAIDQLKQEVREGRIGVERLLDVIAMLQRQLQAAQQRIEELEKNAGNPTSKMGEPFSVRSEEKRQQAQHKKKSKRRKSRCGRLSTKDKLELAGRTEQIFPEGMPEQECRLSHTRPVWRLENGSRVKVMQLDAEEAARSLSGLSRMPDARVERVSDV
jgi:hypothetical protein